jgi:hypothetical protein
MVTKLGPLCKVKLLKNDGDKLVVRSPEKAGGGGSSPSLATTSLISAGVVLAIDSSTLENAYMAMLRVSYALTVGDERLQTSTLSGAECQQFSRCEAPH